MKRKGYTLVEVMVAVMILMLSAEMLALSGTATARIGSRTRKIAKAAERAMSRSEGVPAELEMEISEDSEPIRRDGFIHRETVSGKGGTFTAWSIWMELSVPEAAEEEYEQRE